MSSKWREWLINLGILLVAIGFTIDYLTFFRKILSIGRWSLWASLTLLTAGTLVVLIDQYVRVRRGEQLGLTYVKVLILLFLATASTFFGRLEGLL